MRFHENRQLADNSHVISYLIFVENLLSAAVVIGSFRVNPFKTNGIFRKSTYDKGRLVHCIY